MSAPTVEVRVALAQAGTRGRVHVAAQQGTGTWVARCGRQVRGEHVQTHSLAVLDALPLCPACVDLALTLAPSVAEGFAALLGAPAPVAVALLTVPVGAVRVPTDHVRVSDAGLRASVAEHGVLAPIVVAREEGGYALVVGGRRLAAARAAGLTVIPALVREASPLAALVENLHRTDLDPVAVATAYQRAVDSGLSIAAVARGLGVSRPAVSNALRLLTLSEPVLAHLRSGALSAAHGLALLAHPETAREALADAAVADGATVASLRPETGARPPRTAAPDLAAALAAHLGVTVRASAADGVTRLVLDVPDSDLRRVLAALGA